MGGVSSTNRGTGCHEVSILTDAQHAQGQELLDLPGKPGLPGRRPTGRPDERRAPINLRGRPSCRPRRARWADSRGLRNRPPLLATAFGLLQASRMNTRKVSV
jgi:hypothetical protein